MNKKILFNDGWKFAKSNLNESNPENLEFKDIDIPHDWLIYNSEDLYEDSIGWYKRELNIKKEELSKEIILAFDGVYMDSMLYVNGKQAGSWKYGYSSFEHNITSFLHEGQNEIILKAVNQSPNSRWYSGAGIYRNVYLKSRENNYLCTNGIYISSKKLNDNWLAKIKTDFVLSENVILTHKIIRNGKEINTSFDEINFTGDSECSNYQEISINQPLLWSIDEPNLYKIVTELRKNNNQVIEIVEQNLGFRNISLRPAEGLFINNKKVKIKGVCDHHDFGALGAAFNKAALMRRFKLLKEMGVNAIRTSHYMPAPELMDLADEMGFLIMSEAFDMWERPKTEYDYGRFFKEHALEDVKSWVTRDRNHPCLLFWSIGNEIYDTHADERGQEITRILMDEVKKYDPEENGKVTIASNYMPWENAQKCADIIKVAGYNYADRLYDEHHQKHPDWIIYGSETASLVQSRGVYHFPFESPILTEEDEQCSSLGNSATSWGTKSIEHCIISERDNNYSLGQFIWTGFDYIGEPTPYHTKNSYFGQLDTATFKKDAYYIYQAEWTSYKEKPMIHIFPYWEFNEGELIDVRICSNAPVIEFKVNGKTIEKYGIDHSKDLDLVRTWTIPYKKGEIEAIAYDEEGNIIARDIRKSFGDAEKISLMPDKETIIADGRDLIFVEINMLDQNNNIVENANNRVKVEVSGEGRLVGLDNGDSTDYDQYKGRSRRLFNGKLMAIIMSTLKNGDIEVKVSSKGMESQTMSFKSISSSKEIRGITAKQHNLDMVCVMGREDEIPLRKIEISSIGNHLFNQEQKEINIEAKLYPADTSYREVEWSVVNETGIKTNIASIEPKGTEAIVKAIADGSFKIRCTSNNGTDKVKLISELEYKIEGLGTAYKNPYEFISAGLFDHSKGEIGNGNEKGIASSRNGETVVEFSNIDFGKVGSDLITLPIFALDGRKYNFEIWQGMPGVEGSCIIAHAEYEKPSIWNVYQEESYHLNKVLKGIGSISFVFHDKVHLKGFVFEKKNRAFEKINAIEADSIYGDAYTIAGGNVEGIGNNVSLVWQEINLGSSGVDKIRICGRSAIDKNTINIQFEGETGINKQMVEFKYSEKYEEQVFKIDKAAGINKITLIFLPGSNFDLKWICLES